MILHFEHPRERCLKVCGPAFKGWGTERGLSAKLTFRSTPAKVISHFDWQCLYKCSRLFSGLPPHACSTGMFLPAWKLCCDLSLGRRCRRAMPALSFSRGTKTRLSLSSITCAGEQCTRSIYFNPQTCRYVISPHRVPIGYEIRR